MPGTRPDAKTASANLTEAKKRKLRDMVDLFRGGPDEVRGNQTAAYRAVYPRASKASASAEAGHAFKLPFVQELLAEHAKRVSDKADITQEKVLRQVFNFAFSDPRKIYNDDGSIKPISELDDETAMAVQGIKVARLAEGSEGVVLDIKLVDKNSAAEKLMKHLGMFEKDNQQKTESLADALLAGVKRVKEMKGE